MAASPTKGGDGHHRRTLLGRGLVYQSMAALLMLLGFILTYDSELGSSLQRRLRAYEYNTGKPPDWSQESHVGSAKVAAFLERLRETTRLAGGGADYSLTAEERLAWHAKYPCLSRSELLRIYASRKHVKELPDSPLWDLVWEEYSNLHRVCMKRVGSSLKDRFLNSSNASIPGCKFVVAEGTNGLGNKFLVTASAVLYAILSQRVLLIPFTTSLGSLLCEPFVGSSWIFEDRNQRFPMPGKFGPAERPWQETDAFEAIMKAKLQARKIGESGNCTQSECGLNPPPSLDALTVTTLQPGLQNWQPREWFYCRTGQDFLSEVPWLYMSGCIYWVPKMFGSPAFSSILKALFPENLVLTRLLRSSMLPSNRVWSRFRHLNHAYFGQANRRVSIQVRFFGPQDKMSPVMNDRVLSCVVHNGILPNISDSVAGDGINSTEGSQSPTSTTMVLITSLYRDLHDHLKDFYLRSQTVTGEDVGLVQLTNHKHQRGGPEEDTEAMVEVLLLSVSDELLVTPVSTFGGLAQGYGGLVPWFIRTWGSTRDSPCERGNTVDPCQQGSSPEYDCPYDSSPNHERKSVSLIGSCLPIDATGIQILQS